MQFHIFSFPLNQELSSFSMGSQNWWFGDPRPLLHASKLLHSIVQWFLGQAVFEACSYQLPIPPILSHGEEGEFGEFVEGRASPANIQWWGQGQQGMETKRRSGTQVAPGSQWFSQ